MSHEIETMAFANEVPWHGLGNRVNPDVTVDEMLIAAGLNWDVKLHPTFAKVGDDYIRVPNKSALIRETDKRILTTASDNWKPVQNREVLEFFREYAEAGGAKLETAGSLKGGKMVWGLANLGRGFTTNNGRDAVKGYLLFASPHEVGKAATVRATGVRVVCANTMRFAMNSEAKSPVYSQNHLKEFDFARAKEVVGLAHEDMATAEANAKKLEALRLSEYDTVRVLAHHFQPEMSVRDEDITTLVNDVQKRSQGLHQVLLSNEQAPGAIPGNGWGVLNAVTYWADHVAGRSQDARLGKAWFGENDLLKMNVQRDLLEMAA